MESLTVVSEPVAAFVEGVLVWRMRHNNGMKTTLLG